MQNGYAAYTGMVLYLDVSREFLTKAVAREVQKGAVSNHCNVALRPPEGHRREAALICSPKETRSPGKSLPVLLTYHISH